MKIWVKKPKCKIIINGHSETYVFLGFFFLSAAFFCFIQSMFYCSTVFRLSAYLSSDLPYLSLIISSPPSATCRLALPRKPPYSIILNCERTLYRSYHREENYKETSEAPNTALVTVASLSKCWKPVISMEANMLACLAEEKGCCIPRKQER